MNRIRFLTRALLLPSLFYMLPSNALAKGGDFDAVVRNVKVTCGGKRVRIPFLGLAGFATKLVRPAGVKGFKLAVFEDLERSGGAAQLAPAVSQALGPEWRPLVRVRSRREGAQTLVYVSDAGENLKLMIVTIDGEQATVIRAKVNPEALAKFARDPKLLGVPLND
jgi:hypothetical protein